MGSGWHLSVLPSPVTLPTSGSRVSGIEDRREETGREEGREHITDEIIFRGGGVR